MGNINKVTQQPKGFSGPDDGFVVQENEKGSRSQRGTDPSVPSVSAAASAARPPWRKRSRASNHPVITPRGLGSGPLASGHH